MEAGQEPLEAVVRRMLLLVLAGAALAASAVLEAYVVVEGIAAGATAEFVASTSIFQATLITMVIQHFREQSRGVHGIVATSYFFVVVLAATAIFSVLTCTPYYPAR